MAWSVCSRPPPPQFRPDHCLFFEVLKDSIQVGARAWKFASIVFTCALFIRRLTKSQLLIGRGAPRGTITRRQRRAFTAAREAP